MRMTVVDRLLSAYAHYLLTFLSLNNVDTVTPLCSSFHLAGETLKLRWNELHCHMIYDALIESNHHLRVIDSSGEMIIQLVLSS